MPTMDELLGPGFKSTAAADAATGISVLSQMGTVTFERYVRVVLPSDGYVFWVLASLLSPSALVGSMLLNRVPIGKAAQFETSAPNTFTCQGSFHWDAATRQEEAQNYSASTAVFTALQQVNDLKDVAPGTVWIAKRDGMTFAFSSQGYFYRTMDLFHYRGMAVYSDLLTQVVDNMGLVNLSEPVVSNSLPLWLSFNSYQTFYGFKTAGIPVYPSFLVPDNQVPPYASVHVVPDSTQSLTAAPHLSPRLSHDQMVSETVRVTMSGTRNFNAMDFMDFVNQYTLDTGNFGLRNMPTLRDRGAERTQPELLIMAQRKSAEFEINYHQRRARDVARQLIVQSIPSFTFQ